MVDFGFLWDLRAVEFKKARATVLTVSQADADISVAWLLTAGPCVWQELSFLVADTFMST
jgi:hypothetical protein